jgi:hypothetical protein
MATVSVPGLSKLQGLSGFLAQGHIHDDKCRHPLHDWNGSWNNAGVMSAFGLKDTFLS